MKAKNFIDMVVHKKCSHKNIKWSNSVCMIAGYKKEGICLDCGKQLLEGANKEVIER